MDLDTQLLNCITSSKTARLHPQKKQISWWDIHQRAKIEACIRSAKRYTSTYLWVHENPYLARTAHELDIFWRCCKHMDGIKRYLVIIEDDEKKQLDDITDCSIHKVYHSHGRAESIKSERYSIHLDSEVIESTALPFTDHHQRGSEVLGDYNRSDRYEWFKAFP